MKGGQNKMKFDIEKKTQVWLGALILVLSLVWVFASLGRTDFVIWIALIFGIFLSIFLFIEGGVYEYWRSKGYRKIEANDFLVWLTMFVSGAVFLNSIAFIGVVRNVIPDAVLGFLSGVGVITGVIGGTLGAIYILVPKPKA